MKRIGTLLVLLVVFVITGVPVFASEEVYIVKSGDNLWSIARQHNMLVAEIKELNHLTSDLLHIGDKLLLQADETSTNTDTAAESTENALVNTDNSKYYNVKAGDCLWSIANSHGMTIDQIRRLNNLKSDALFPGDRLLINGTAQVDSNTAPPEEEQTDSNNESYQDAPDQTSAPSRSGSTIIAATILQEAAKYIGTPYKYGGSGPGGFDCSGFVKYVFNQYGYSLPRTASDQASTGVHVDKPDLKPGDLVFFKCGGSKINHAGIYTGNGMFIHSSSPSSGGVIYSSLVDGYYLKTYVGARRVLY